MAPVRLRVWFDKGVRGWFVAVRRVRWRRRWRSGSSSIGGDAGGGAHGGARAHPPDDCNGLERTISLRATRHRRYICILCIAIARALISCVVRTHHGLERRPASSCENDAFLLRRMCSSGGVTLYQMNTRLNMLCVSTSQRTHIQTRVVVGRVCPLGDADVIFVRDRRTSTRPHRSNPFCCCCFFYTWNPDDRWCSSST